MKQETWQGNISLLTYVKSWPFWRNGWESDDWWCRCLGQQGFKQKLPGENGHFKPKLLLKGHFIATTATFPRLSAPGMTTGTRPRTDGTYKPRDPKLVLGCKGEIWTPGFELILSYPAVLFCFFDSTHGKLRHRFTRSFLWFYGDSYESSPRFPMSRYWQIFAAARSAVFQEGVCCFVVPATVRSFGHPKCGVGCDVGRLQGSLVFERWSNAGENPQDFWAQRMRRTRSFYQVSFRMIFALPTRQASLSKLTMCPVGKKLTNLLKVPSTRECWLEFPILLDRLQLPASKSIVVNRLYVHRLVVYVVYFCNLFHTK